MTEVKLIDNARKPLRKSLEQSIRLRTALVAILKNPCPDHEHFVTILKEILSIILPSEHKDRPTYEPTTSNSRESSLQEIRIREFLDVIDALLQLIKAFWLRATSDDICNERVTIVGLRWERLCRDVQECVILDHQLGHSIGKLAEICSSDLFFVHSANHDGSAYFLQEVSTP